MVKKYVCGNRIKQALKDRKMTAKQLAVELGKDAEEVQTWLDDKAMPTMNDLYSMMVVTQKDANYFFGDIDPTFAHIQECKERAATYELERRISNVEQVLAHLIQNHFNKK